MSVYAVVNVAGVVVVVAGTPHVATVKCVFRVPRYAMRNSGLGGTKHAGAGRGGL